jgi:hypothetical protein
MESSNKKERNWKMSKKATNFFMRSVQDGNGK